MSAEKMDCDGLPPVPSGYIIKKVPIGLLSDSVFTPDLPLRGTQPTIGYFLTEKKSIADESYGVHKTEYGGSGEIKRITGEQEQTVPRKANHLRSALHGFPEPPVPEKILAKRVMDNKEFFASPINKLACDIFHLSSTSKPVPKTGPKQMFPRSVLYEMEYVKEQYRKAIAEALEKERKEFEELIRNSALNKKEQETESSGNLLNTKPNEVETKDEMTTGEAQADDLISEEKSGNTKNRTCKSFCGSCGCILEREGCPKCNKKAQELRNKMEKGFEYEECPKWNEQFPKYGAPWGNQRQTEMMRVLYPFRTEASRWNYCLIPPFDASVCYKSSKTRFPEKSFSSVNI